MHFILDRTCLKTYTNYDDAGARASLVKTRVSRDFIFRSVVCA